MGAKKYTAKDIAHYIVNKCIDDNKQISNLQLQKILYFVQEHYIKSTGHPLFDDAFVAWTYGPVIRSVYWEFSMNGGDRICQKCDPVDIDCDVISKIDPIIEKDANMYPWQLVEKSHRRGYAWDKTYKGGRGFGDEIALSLIKEDAKCC